MTTFKTAKKTFSGLDAATTAQLVSSCSDIALVLDKKGVVRDLNSVNEHLVAAGCADWQGRAWSDTVTVESRIKIDELLTEAQTKPATRWRQVNHPVAGSSDLPVRYCAMRLGDDGRVLAIGQDLRGSAELQSRLIRVEQELEREYLRLRALETRYRSLFQMTSEAVLVAEASGLKIIEANPASIKMLANGSRRIIGRQFSELIAPAFAIPLEALLASVRATPRADEIEVVTAAGERRVRLAASLYRQDDQSYFLFRMTSLEPDSMPRSLGRSDAMGVLQHLPEGLAIVDVERRVLTANSAFLELTELTSEEQVRGEPIDRWLGRVELDMDILFASLREHGSVRRFATIARGEFGAKTDIEIAAVAVPNAAQPCVGLSVRKVTREPIALLSQGQALPRSMQQLTELVGRVPLKDLVRETTDIIERMCIEAALELTGDNRASAAEMLGLSRQSLYVKLRRFGLSELDGDT